MLIEQKLTLRYFQFFNNPITIVRKKFKHLYATKSPRLKENIKMFIFCLLYICETIVS